MKKKINKSTLSLKVQKDILQQEIVEGSPCVFVMDSMLKFGVVIESRNHVKVGYIGSNLQFVNNMWQHLEVVCNKWIESSKVVMVKEDWLFDLLDAPTLMKMAEIRGSCADEIQSILEAKEKRKLLFFCKNRSEEFWPQRLFTAETACKKLVIKNNIFKNRAVYKKHIQ